MKKIIGILGGMGPMASCTIYKQILEYCQLHYGSVQDHEYPRIIINSLALEGFDETGVCNEQLVKGQLIQGVQMLQNAYCDYIIMACNTVHIYHAELQSSVYTPIINVIEEIKERLRKAGHTCVGLLSSKTTKDAQLYQNKLSQYGINCLELDDGDQTKIDQVIKNVMGGKQGERDKILLYELTQKFHLQGATAIVLGCTELPLVIEKYPLPLPTSSANEAIVETVVKKCFGY